MNEVYRGGGAGIQHELARQKPTKFFGHQNILGNFMRRIFERAGRGAITERGFMGTEDGVMAPGRVSLLNSTFYSS